MHYMTSSFLIIYHDVEPLIWCLCGKEKWLNETTTTAAKTHSQNMLLQLDSLVV